MILIWIITIYTFPYILEVSMSGNNKSIFTRRDFIRDVSIATAGAAFSTSIRPIQAANAEGNTTGQHLKLGEPLLIPGPVRLYPILNVVRVMPLMIIPACVFSHMFLLV